jgi:DNA-binding response OmpR family regulator
MLQPLTPVRQLRILVVDDHLDSARALARLLRYEGHAVVTAGTLADALALARGGTFELLVCDIELPDGNGCDLVRFLRDRNDGEPTGAIVLTGHDEPQWHADAHQAGCHDYLVKPLVFDELLAAINRLWPAVGRGAERAIAS